MSAITNPLTEASWPGRLRRARTLGENREPTRRLYFTDFPLLLLITGMCAWIWPTDAMLAVSSFVGAVVGFYTLWEIVFRVGPIRFSHIVCISNTVGYGFGALNSWLTISRGSMGLAQFFGKDTEAITHAMGAVLIASGILCALGEVYEPPIFGRNFRLTFDSRSTLLIFFGTALMIVGYRLGILGYMGVATSGGHISVIAGFLGWFYPALFAYTCTVFLNWQRGWLKRIFGFIILAQLLMIFPTGRRNFLYSLILAMIATRFGSFRPKLSFSKKIIYAAVFAGVLSLAVTAFYYLRVAGSKARGSTVSIFERVNLAIDIYQSGDTAKVTGSLQDNLQKRTFVLGYLSDLLDASSRMPTAMGKNAVHEFQLIIPSVFWAEKDQILYQEESVANDQFNLAFGDEANSTATAGAIDFGLWGIIVYPIFVCVLFRLLAEFLGGILPAMATAFLMLPLIFNLLMTEAGLWIHLVALRDCLTFAVLLVLFSRMPRFSFSDNVVKRAAFR